MYGKQQMGRLGWCGCTCDVLMGSRGTVKKRCRTTGIDVQIQHGCCCALLSQAPARAILEHKK